MGLLAFLFSLSAERVLFLISTSCFALFETADKCTPLSRISKPALMPRATCIHSQNKKKGRVELAVAFASGVKAN